MPAYADGVATTPTPGQRLRAQERTEERAIKRTHALVEKLIDVSEPIWHWGDGDGGYVMTLIQDAAKARRGA